MVVIPPRPSLGMTLIMQHIEIGFATGTRGQSHRDLTQASTQLIHAALIIHPPMCTRRANPPNAKIRFERWSRYSRGSRALAVFFEKQRFSSTDMYIYIQSFGAQIVLESVLNLYLCREFRNVSFLFDGNDGNDKILTQIYSRKSESRILFRYFLRMWIDTQSLKVQNYTLIYKSHFNTIESGE